MDLSTICIWCWLIPLIIGLLCAYMGYLIGKGSKKDDRESQRVKELEKENARLEAELKACREQTGVALDATSAQSGIASSLAASDSDAGTATGNEVQSTVEIPFDSAAAKAALGKSVKLNDLKIIEGIGPKIENLFNNEGITTWLQLADANVARCREVLTSGGDRYRLHDPASWPMQARMCAEGKWKDLARWQDDHKRGKL